MRITEARLRQIVLEEVKSRLLEQIIAEELDKYLLEIEADWDAAKRKARRKNIRNMIGGAAALGGTALGIQGQVSDHEDALAADAAAEKQQNYEQSSTIDNSVKELEKQAGNFFSWTWQTSDTQTLPFPANPENESEAVLPLEWSVLAQVTQDLKAESPQYDVDKNFLQAANSPDLLASAYKNTKGEASSGPATDFFKDFSPDTYPLSDASDFGAHQFKSNNPGVPSAMVDTDGDGAPDTQNLVYVPFDDIPDDHIMSVSGLTKVELYKKYYYGDAMNLEMFKKLKGQIKENRVSWRNYKNRKKKLA